jgi:hypothetical protein
MSHDVEHGLTVNEQLKSNYLVVRPAWILSGVMADSVHPVGTGRLVKRHACSHDRPVEMVESRIETKD